MTAQRWIARPIAVIITLILELSAIWSARAQQIHHERRATECASFTPTICAAPDAHLESSRCPGCKFDASRTFYCPLVAGGYYSYRTGTSEGGGCPNGPFMAQTHHMPPSCGARCCRTDHDGRFVEDDPIVEDGRKNDDYDYDYKDDSSTPPSKIPRVQFEPTDSTCRYKEISRGQVMRFLGLHNASLVVVGDSTMRQL